MSNQTILDRVAASAQHTPQAIAIDGSAQLSYKELHGRLGCAVVQLNRLGLGRNDRVALVLPNGPEMAVAFLGVACAAVSAVTLSARMVRTMRGRPVSRSRCMAASPDLAWMIGS